MPATLRVKKAPSTDDRFNHLEKEHYLVGKAVSPEAKYGNSSSSNTSANAVAIASGLTSAKAINVKIGNSSTFERANLAAQQIAFVNTDPKGDSNLILNGSTNTSQTSQPKKSETAGVYQSASGNGQTTQTLNQTTLKGNFSFDNALKITAQIPQEAMTG